MRDSDFVYPTLQPPTGPERRASTVRPNCHKYVRSCSAAPLAIHIPLRATVTKTGTRVQRRPTEALCPPSTSIIPQAAPRSCTSSPAPWICSRGRKWAVVCARRYPHHDPGHGHPSTHLSLLVGLFVRLLARLLSRDQNPSTENWTADADTPPRNTRIQFRSPHAKRSQRST